MKLSVRFVLLFLSFSFFLNSCFKEDTPVTPYDRGQANIGYANIGSDYNTTLYYNLSSNKVIKSIKLDDWDLAFETNDTSFFIIINPALIGGAYNLGQVPFDTVLKTTQVKKLHWRYDNYSLPPDSGAIGIWWKGVLPNVESKQDVYIINLGVDDDGRSYGFKKIQIISRDNQKYVIKFSGVDSKEATVFEIPIDKKYHRMTFSFKGGGSITYSEPEARTWDLVFTRYAEYFEEINFEPYTTNGVLQNPNVCYAYADSVGKVTYENFTINDYDEKKLSKYSNVIGWDWKKYYLDLGYYSVRTDKYYILKDNQGFIYKLRFIDFYTPIDGKNVKGNISFEFLKL